MKHKYKTLDADHVCRYGLTFSSWMKQVDKCKTHDQLFGIVEDFIDVGKDFPLIYVKFAKEWIDKKGLDLHLEDINKIKKQMDLLK